jgi:hypothetical protein
VRIALPDDAEIEDQPRRCIREAVETLAVSVPRGLGHGEDQFGFCHFAERGFDHGEGFGDVRILQAGLQVHIAPLVVAGKSGRAVLPQRIDPRLAGQGGVDRIKQQLAGELRHNVLDMNGVTFRVIRIMMPAGYIEPRGEK